MDRSGSHVLLNPGCSKTLRILCVFLDIGARVDVQIGI
jgi:hypothetical protein